MKQREALKRGVFMRIDGTIQLTPKLGLFAPQDDKAENTRAPSSANAAGFKNIFDDLAAASSEASAESRAKRALILTGELEDFPAAMIASERSGILFELNLNMRNKVIDAYQEILRTQV